MFLDNFEYSLIMEDSIFEDDNVPVTVNDNVPVTVNDTFSRLEQYKKDFKKVIGTNQYENLKINYTDYIKQLEDNPYIFEIPLVQALINEIDEQMIAFEQKKEDDINSNQVLSRLEQYHEEFQKIITKQVFDNPNKQIYEDLKIDYIDFQIYLHNYGFIFDNPLMKQLIEKIDENIIFLENKFLGQMIEETKKDVDPIIPINKSDKKDTNNVTIEVIKKPDNYVSFALSSNKTVTVYTGQYTDTDISHIIRNHQYY